MITCFVMCTGNNLCGLRSIIRSMTIIKTAAWKRLVCTDTDTRSQKWVLFGGNVVTLQKILGHSSLDITQKYLSFIAIVISIVYLCVNVGKQLFVFKHPIVCFMAMGIFLLISQANIPVIKIIF